MDKQQFQALQHKHAVEQAAERMHDAVNTLERGIDEMQRYIQRFDQATNDDERGKVINRFLTYLASGITANIRFDLLADSQAQLSVFAALRQQEVVDEWYSPNPAIETQWVFLLYLSHPYDIEHRLRVNPEIIGLYFALLPLSFFRRYA